MAFPPSPGRGELPGIDPLIWKTCAGSNVQIPTIDSRVYYFPQGHAEQSSSSPDFSSVLWLKPLISCRIAAIRFLANPETDEVFAIIRLDPIPAVACVSVQPTISPLDLDAGDVVSFSKILTPSDANNGGGFSVPRFCADSIFPRLNFSADPPVQTISIRDVHGTAWEFRHIYRGTPRRHLLTTGWSKFVNQKKLVAGDSVLFIKHRSGELFVGIRRARPSGGSAGDCGRWVKVAAADESGKVGEEGFLRSGKGSIPAESIVEAVQLACAGRPFEVVYYPNAASPDFVVRAETVENAMKVCWTAGLRVKMAMETEDSSRMTWFQGTVSSIVALDAGIWRASPWRLLQVTWDEPEVLQNVKRVNPWEVEVASSTPQMQTLFPSPKKTRLSQGPELLTDGEGTMFFPTMGSHVVMGNMNPSLFNCNTFPAGMQGARHNQICVPSLPSFNHHLLDKICVNNMAPQLLPVSTPLDIGNTSRSDNFAAAPVQSNSCFFGEQPFGNQIGEPMKRTGGSSIQLFGQIIQTKQPAEAVIENGECMGDNSVKEYKRPEGEPHDYSLSYTYKQLCSQLDPQCQRVSAVGGSL